MPNLTAADVAEYILAKQGRMSAMKLHRLLYYSQAWHLAWEGKPLFDDEIQAWANGPVVASVYELHRGEFTVEPGFTGRRVPEVTASAADETEGTSSRDKRRRRTACLVASIALAATLLVALLAALRR